MSIEINEENKQYFSVEALKNYEIKLKEFNIAKNNLEEAEDNLKIDLVNKILKFTQSKEFLNELNANEFINFEYLEYEIIEFRQESVKGINQEEKVSYFLYNQFPISNLIQLINYFEEIKNNEILNKKREIISKLQNNILSMEDLDKIEKILEE